jgi:NitT/TauT family transport system substrate-binding protein
MRRRTALAAVGGLLFPNVVLRRGATAQALTPMIAAGLPEDSATPVLYGVASGLYRKAGLAVEMQPQSSGPAVVSGLAGGSYQIGKSGTPALIAAHSRGAPLVIVAPAGLSDTRSPIAALLVRADSPIKRAADLDGKTIAVGALTDVFSLSTRVWADKNGGDASSLKFVEITIGAMAPALDAGRIDACSMNEPILSAALGTGKFRILARNFDAIAPRFMYTAWFTTRDYLDANRKAVGDFVRATLTAANYVNSHHAETIDLIAKFASLDPDTVRKMGRVEQGTSLDPRLLQPVIDACAKYKFVTAPFDAKELLVTPG